MLERFFAVTTTSIYEVNDGGGVRHLPVVKKIALRGRSDIIVGGTLEAAGMVSVGSQIITFIPQAISSVTTGDPCVQRELGLVNPRYRGGNTSSVVALFLTEAEARSCLDQNSDVVCDPRWLKQTETVIAAIGDNHPKFSVSHTPELALIQQKT